MRKYLLSSLLIGIFGCVSDNSERGPDLILVKPKYSFSGISGEYNIYTAKGNSKDLINGFNEFKEKTELNIFPAIDALNHELDTFKLDLNQQYLDDMAALGKMVSFYCKKIKDNKFTGTIQIDTISRDLHFTIQKDTIILNVYYLLTVHGMGLISHFYSENPNLNLDSLSKSGSYDTLYYFQGVQKFGNSI